MDDGITLEDRTSAEIIMPTDGNNCGVDELISQAKQRADARNGFTWHGQNSVDFTQVIEIMCNIYIPHMLCASHPGV